MPKAHKKFFADPAEPYPCEFCGEPIIERGRTAASLVRHHVDHDPMNNEEVNIVALHRSCHEQHHKVGKRHTPESKRKISEARKAWLSDPAHREQIAAALRGREVPDSTKLAVAESNRRRAHARRKEVAAWDVR